MEYIELKLKDYQKLVEYARKGNIPESLINEISSDLKITDYRR